MQGESRLEIITNIPSRTPEKVDLRLVRVVAAKSKKSNADITAVAKKYAQI